MAFYLICNKLKASSKLQSEDVTDRRIWKLERNYYVNRKRNKRIYPSSSAFEIRRKINQLRTWKGTSVRHLLRAPVIQAVYEQIIAHNEQQFCSGICNQFSSEQTQYDVYVYYVVSKSEGRQGVPFVYESEISCFKSGGIYRLSSCGDASTPCMFKGATIAVRNVVA